MKLEERFQADMLRYLTEAEKVTGIRESRLPKEAEAYGAPQAAAARIRKGRTSAQFNALRQAGKLEWSLEALITKGIYASLFDDETVNICLSTLLEAGYYG